MPNPFDASSSLDVKLYVYDALWSPKSNKKRTYMYKFTFKIWNIYTKTKIKNQSYRATYRQL